MNESVLWRLKCADEAGASSPSYDDSGWEQIQLGDKFASTGFAWLRARFVIPKSVLGERVKGKPIALRLNCGDGEVYIDGQFYGRYDNDHPAMILLSETAEPGKEYMVAIRLYMSNHANLEGTYTLEECSWVIHDPRRVRDAFRLTVDCSRTEGRLWQPFSGLSQGAGMQDYDPGTAAVFREIGIKWFRMDNILTQAVKRGEDGKLIYDWTDVDRRTDFIKSIGAEPIYCLSYMPKVLDATDCPHRHSRPNDWDAWEELCYQAVKHCVDRGTPVKYWEVWNETNTGWITVLPGEDLLTVYLQMYDRCARAVKRADPNALIGGPCNAAGPWDDGDKIGLPGVRGEAFLRGLIQHCSQTNTPLDFISWHEYFHPWWIMVREVERTREILAEYPETQKNVKELMVTEWSFAWWHDLPHDNEIGAAYCAAGAIRAWSAMKVDKPCYFFAKDGSPPFHGNWGMLTANNTPKAVGNVCRMFNMMAPNALEIQGFEKDPSGNSDPQDTDLCGLASIDSETGRMTILLVNFPNRHGIPRKIALELRHLPESLRSGTLRRWLVDKQHSNVFHDLTKGRLEVVDESPLGNRSSIHYQFALDQNGVTLIEFLPANTKELEN
ncbi:MAG TPA: hypothetical protein PKH07_03150 [bacterium]|nr:hypothetical protein [bacterium]